ncbi:MAG: LysR family transcriptional regulator, partial [Proteobacteria bacterium]|nr:LysR family transcriptional regulator [Pseudomonadota bacterium]
MRPDLDALVALDAVVRHGGVAQAAAHLHKVPSAVSYQLRKLEDQLGLALLDRAGYRVRLTPAGEAVLAEGRRLIAHAEQVASVAQQFGAGWEPRLTMIVDGILPLEPTLRALRTLADERVPTRIQVKVEFLGGVQFRFERDAADLMLVKDFAPDPHLRAEALPEIECVLCAAPDHPLAARRRVDLAELHDHVELSVQDSSDQGDDRHMFGGERVFYLSDFVAKKRALVLGLGFGWMPLYLVARELGRGTLREIRYVGGSRYRFTPLLVDRLNRGLGRTAARLCALLRAEHWPPAATPARGARPSAAPRTDARA